MENKAQFVAELGDLLSLHSRAGVRWLKYYKDGDGFEAVTIIYTNGNTKTINVTADSCTAIMMDVARAIL